MRKTFKIQELIVFKRYDKLRNLIESERRNGDNGKADEYLLYYISAILCNPRETNIRFLEIINIISCMSPDMIPKALDKLIDSPSVMKGWLGNILNRKIVSALGKKKIKYIKTVMDADAINAVDIMKLYDSNYTTQEDKQFIKENFKDFIKRNPSYLSDVLFTQQSQETEILSNDEIRNMAIELEDSHTLHLLMQYSLFDSQSLFDELCKLKNKNKVSKYYYILAMIEFCPQNLNGISFAEFINEVSSLAFNKSQFIDEMLIGETYGGETISELIEKAAVSAIVFSSTNKDNGPKKASKGIENYFPHTMNTYGDGNGEDFGKEQAGVAPTAPYSMGSMPKSTKNDQNN